MIKTIPMNASDLNQFSEQIIRDAAFGMTFLAVILLSNTFFFIQIYFWFTRSCAKLQKVAPYQLIARFMAAVLLMSLVQLASILIWTAAIYSKGLIDDIRLAMLFSGSCYTTLGVFSDILPDGWKSLAFYIAFSGLFSFAMATSAMMSMLSVITRRLYKAT